MSTNPTGSEIDTEPLDSPKSLVGRTLNREYRLARMVKLGGMGAIFRAEQLTTGRRVAVKVLKPSKAEKNDLVRRFEREGEVLTRISHPNIVTLIDSGRDAGGLSYLVLEYVEGATFRDALDRGALTLVEILDVFIQVASALSEAHDADVIHRDLKFENVMLTRLADGRLHVTVLDFGVAKPIASPENRELTRKGQVPGTPLIIAPELLDEQPPSPRSDLYSLGVLLYTALAGQPPFQAKHELELMRAHTTQPVPDLEGHAAAYVPSPLVELTERLLRKEPGDRPQSAESVRDVFERVRRRIVGRSAAARPYEAGARASDHDSDGGIARGEGPEGSESGWVERLFGDD